MRIAFTPHAYWPSIGGAQQYTRGLAEALAHLGHQVHVVVPDALDPEAFYGTEPTPTGTTHEIIEDVAVHRLPVRGRWRRRPKSDSRIPLAGYRRQLRRKLDALRPDVVFTLPHLFPNVESTIDLRGRRPWILVYAPMLHEADPYWPVDRVTRAAGRVDIVVGLTDHERRRLIDGYEVAPASAVVISPGVRVPVEPPPIEREPVVLFVGRLTKSKRIDILIEAIARVRREIPEAKLVVAGATSQPAESDLGDAGDAVTRIDNPSDEQRDRLFATASLLANPSTVESFGLSTLEAWAHGTPVLAADTPVNQSVIRHGVDGFVAEPTAEAFAARIVEALRSTDLAAMGDAGRRRVVSEFTWPDAARRLEAILEDRLRS